MTLADRTSLRNLVGLSIRLFLTLLCLMAIIMPLSAKKNADVSKPTTEKTVWTNGYTFPIDLDRQSAIEHLSDMPLAGPEGIWEFEPDEVTLMILADHHSPGRYGIYVVEAVDCRLFPGLRIGHLEESLDKNSFHLHLMTRWKKNNMDLPVKGTAKLNAKEGLLAMEGKSLKLSLNPSVILPNMLSLLRLRVGLKWNDPADKLPTGLRRVFPAPSALTRVPAWL